MKNSWKDQLLETTTHERIWRSIAALLAAMVLVLTGLIVYQAIVQVEEIKAQRIIILDDKGKHLVESSSKMSDAYIRSVHTKIVNLMESWTYKNIESNYDQLFSYYFNHEVENLVKANMLSSQLVGNVKERKMISIFEIDEKSSRHEWCLKVGKACSLIVGTREIFVSHNEPLKRIRVSYLLFSKAVFPKSPNEFALRVNRLIISDTGKDPTRELQRIFRDAKKGGNI